MLFYFKELTGKLSHMIGKGGIKGVKRTCKQDVNRGLRQDVIKTDAKRRRDMSVETIFLHVCKTPIQL